MYTFDSISNSHEYRDKIKYCYNNAENYCQTDSKFYSDELYHKCKSHSSYVSHESSIYRNKYCLECEKGNISYGVFNPDNPLADKHQTFSDLFYTLKREQDKVVIVNAGQTKWTCYINPSTSTSTCARPRACDVTIGYRGCRRHALYLAVHPPPRTFSRDHFTR